MAPGELASHTLITYPTETFSSTVISVPLTEPQIHLLVKNKLIPLLPYPLVVVRRIQWELRHPSPAAQVYLALYALTSFDVTPTTSRTELQSQLTSWLSEPATSPPPPTAPFLVSYLNLLPAGQTQSWVFSTSEIPPSHAPPFASFANALEVLTGDTVPLVASYPPPPSDPITYPPTQPATAPIPLLRHLFTHILTHLIPQRPAEPPADWLWLRDNKKYLSQPYSTRKVLFGSIHSSLIPWFSLPSTTRRDGQYVKLLMPPGAWDPAANASRVAPRVDFSGAPFGYELGTLVDAELQTVLDRSPIPRTLGTLREMPNVGLYTSTGPRECVGWGFLSKDGSLSSLHVEEAHRKKGLATCLGRELLALQAQHFSVKGVEDAYGAWWGMADVEENNVSSRRVMEKLGAEVWWGIQWVEIDVGIVLGGLEKVEV
ncbi:uncharacterized protein HMPREF1541_02750 [Cyphellophora europaea CBS 101466]|uniref:GCN5-related N-acetyltransferase Rv2170-like domain-containing protein n=1 Tax=Cyphellophora europaea (strain CBS 101466) TaxID=1220924 RepID=W2S4G0_CYPE1|nr:uncharacterized protein HMPREF1541_02750 [Cyphellophora europaea CBS 101466]ETN43591.1 hypothetical protein HMPREF1541_02750 [Cyphellophora europaea CBS 101466]